MKRCRAKPVLGKKDSWQRQVVSVSQFTAGSVYAFYASTLPAVNLGQSILTYVEDRPE